MVEDAGSVARERVYVLDLFRFVAASLVVGYHLLAPSDVWGTDTGVLFTHPLRQFFRYGWVGVELFFVISGFVICMSAWGRRLTDFVISRVTRLYPAYLCAVLLTTVVLLLWPLPVGRPHLTQVLANLTMVHGLLDIPGVDTVYWTLLVELKFYLLFAIVVWRGVTYRRTVLFCLLWTVASLFAEFAHAALLEALLEPRYSPYFVAGIVAYLIFRFGGNLLLWAMFGVSFILCAISLERVVDELVAVHEHVSYPGAFAFLVAILGATAAVALRRLTWVRWRGLLTIGLLTYPLYLVHQAIGHVVIRRFAGQVSAWLLLGLVLLGVLGLAWLVHLAVERPVAPLLRAGLAKSFAQIRMASSPSPVPAPATGPQRDGTRFAPVGVEADTGRH